MTTPKKTIPDSLPLTGFSRARQLLPFLPFTESTLWKWARAGKFPKPVQFSPTVTAWRNEDVHAWLQAHQQEASA